MLGNLLVVAIGFLTVGTVYSQAKSAVPAAPAPSFFQEASDCAAAFESRVLERRAQPRSEARNQAILNDTQLGFVYVGVAYEKGLRNPEAGQMLKVSQKRWAALSKAEQQALLSTCTAKAQQLMKDINAFERYIVKNRAQARVDKLLRNEKP
jgi:hypothetical protein